jgi:hypothetical protein
MTAVLVQVNLSPTPSAEGVAPSRAVLFRHRANRTGLRRFQVSLRELTTTPLRRWALAAGALAAAAVVLLLARPDRAPTPVVAKGGRASTGSHTHGDRHPEKRSGPDKPEPHPLPGRRDRPQPRIPRHLPAPGPLEAVRQSPAGADHHPAPPQPDETYLDGRDPRRTAQWMVGSEKDRLVLAWLKQILPPVKDDFVRVPLPRIAAADPKNPPPIAAIGDAIRQYEKEAKVVDARLFKKVTLQLKATSLEDLCAELEKQLDVRLRAAWGVRDEKITVFVKDRPAREVMRAVARLFGYFWTRAGEAGAYRYELVQDLRSQLAEQEMRDRDLNAALVALDDAMSSYRPLLEKPLEQLKAQLEHATGAEKERLSMLVRQGGWGAARLYRHLSLADVAALRSGQRVAYGYSQWHQNRLPEDWKRPLLAASPWYIQQIGEEFVLGMGPVGTPAVDYPGAAPNLALLVDRSELGQVTLKAEAGIDLPNGQGGGLILNLATGRSPSTVKPNNAQANQALRNQPPFIREVTLKPRPSCPRFAEGAKPMPREDPGIEDPITSRPHVSTADVWEAVHRETGMPIVADFYSRLHAVPAVTGEKARLFDALCRVGDTMGLRWRRDDGFLLARSTSFFWDRLKEVPNRTLARWRQAREADGALPVAHVLEIAALSDQQLDSETVGKAVEHCAGIHEWGLFGKGVQRLGPSPGDRRAFCRLLLLLSPQQLGQAAQPQGLPFTALTDQQQREFVRKDPYLMGTTIHTAYVRAGWFIWKPVLPLGTDHQVYSRFPVAAGRTPEVALQAARQVYPDARPEQIHRQRGTLAIWFTDAAGKTVREAGRPEVFFTAQ